MQKNHKFSVKSVDDNNNIIVQNTLTIDEHLDVDLKYLMLSVNKFSGDTTIFCPGYFNKKTNFIIGEINSLIAVDSKLNILKNSDSNTSNIIKNNNYIIYPIPCLNMETNKILEYVDYETSKVIDIELDYRLGDILGQYLSGHLTFSELSSEYPNLSNFFKLFINNERGISFNKNIILNSNPRFVIGIIAGYYNSNNNSNFYINKNVNIYTFTTMLNYIGASYSIRNVKKFDSKKLFLQIPKIFNKYFYPKFRKQFEYGYNTTTGFIEKFSSIVEYDKKTDLISNINSGRFLLIPADSIDFIKITDSRMYDLTSERSDATNYSLPMTPMLKNSDGDILAASGIFTKEALSDASLFSPDNKDYYKDFRDGKISQWIADDAILGLYNATSHK